MAIQTKVRRIGNSLGIALPKEALHALKVEEGATLYLTDAPDGLRLGLGNPDFEKTMQVFKSLNQRYHNALKELAK